MKSDQYKLVRLLVLLMAFSLIGIIMLAGCSSGDETPTEAVATEKPQQGTAILPSPESAETVLVAKENTVMRSGPGLEYPVLAGLSGGEAATLEGISPDGTYYAVSVPVAESGYGWVDVNFADVANATDLRVIQPPPIPPTTEFIGPQPGDPQVTAKDAVYIRTGPGNNYPAYGVAPAGSNGLVFGISEDGLWYTVRLNPEVIGKGHGWVEVALVEAQNVDGLPTIAAPPVGEEVVLPSPEEGAPTATATTYINGRTGPGLNYPVIGVAAPGASALIVGKSADSQWWQVKVDPQFSPTETAWVNAGYVTTTNTENVPVVEAPAPPPVAPEQPPGAYSCVLVSQSPADGTTYAANAAFDMNWQVLNTGQITWDADEAVLQFITAANDLRLSSTDTLPLTADVAAGGSYQVVLDMSAPGAAGQYSETWAIVQGTTVLCQFYNIIQVQ
jgi:uncharacterized protein YraI